MNDEMDYESSGGLVERIKESPRTVSALIIILIVAAAIYAFSGDDTATTPDTGEEAAVTETTTEEEGTEAVAEGEAATETDEADTTDSAVADVEPTEVTQEELADTSKELPAATKDSEGYSEVAQAGDGLTHLSRRAATRWLSENQAGFTVTNEHRIYIEDYIQNKLGSTALGLGETKMISYDLIAEAVTAAGELTESQLTNLTQYSHVL